MMKPAKIDAQGSFLLFQMGVTPTRARGPYEAGEFAFTASFSFDKKTNGLAGVSLSLKEPL